MKSSNSFSIFIWANKAKAEVNGQLPTYARVTVMGKRAEVALKKKVNPKRWDARTGFMKGRYDVHLDRDPCVIDFDPAFSTIHDQKLAQVLASELMEGHLEKTVKKIGQKYTIMQIVSELRDFDWKQAKCALIKLIYSWRATEAFGKKNLKRIVKFIEKSFNISLGNFYDTHYWLCGSPSPTVLSMR